MNYAVFTDANCVFLTKSPNGTTKAIRVMCREIGGLQWVPFWAVHADSPVRKRGDRGKLFVDYAFALKQGWVN